MSKKEKQLVMNDKETIKSDNFLNNDEIVRMIKSNLISILKMILYIFMKI